MPIQQSTYAAPRLELGEAIREFYGDMSGFIAEQVLPVKEVIKKSAYLSVLVRENLTRANAVHSNGAAYNRVTFTTEDLQYTCKDYGLEGQLTDDDRENYASDFDGELETVQNVMTKIMIEQEIRAATAIFNTSTFTGSALYTDVSSAPWDAAASGAIAHILAAAEMVRKNTGVRADSMVIGAVTLQNLLNNTGIANRFPGAPLVTYEMLKSALASIVGIQDVIVGGMIYNSAKEGQTASCSDIWSDDYALIFKKNTGAVSSGGLGRIVRWSAMPQNQVTMYREEQTASDVFRVSQYQEEKIFDPYFGHLLKVDA